MKTLTDAQRNMLERIERNPVVFKGNDGTQMRTLIGLEKAGLIVEQMVDYYGERAKAFVLTEAGREALTGA